MQRELHPHFVAPDMGLRPPVKIEVIPLMKIIGLEREQRLIDFGHDALGRLRVGLGERDGHHVRLGLYVRIFALQDQDRAGPDQGQKAENRYQLGQQRPEPFRDKGAHPVREHRASRVSVRRE